MVKRNTDGTLKVTLDMRDDWLHEGTDEFRHARNELMERVGRALTPEELDELRRSTGSSTS